ncbi:MAG TPA: signal peptidase II [Candidatus Limnocylindrales bacterium]|nr:signal peptidase II [Candidatus Limnocylindrales bacterium]
MAGGHGRDVGGENLDEAATANDTELARRRAVRTSRRPRWELFAVLAVSILVVDQLTKAWIAANVDPARPQPIVGDYLRLIVSHNTGALFGLFRDQAPLFAAFSLAVIALIVWYHSRVGASVVLATALGLLLGGALGNLTDRVRLGYVLDFVDAGIGSLRWYTFNVADAAVSTSLVLLVLVALWPSLAGPPEERAGTDA